MADNNVHTIQARLIQATKTESDWRNNHSDYVPANGEIVVLTEVNSINGNTKIKVGDGQHTLFDKDGQSSLSYIGGTANSGSGKNSTEVNGSDGGILNLDEFHPAYGVYKEENVVKSAAGERATLMGGNSCAIGDRSIAAGSQSIAEGVDSIAAGVDTYAIGKASFVTGTGNKAEKNNQTVIGQYNTDDSTSLLIVGAGSEGARSNAFSAGKDNSGNYLKIGATKFTEGELQKLKISGTTSVGIGGIPKGKTYNGADLRDVLVELLFPYVALTLNSITLHESAGVYEYGDEVTVSKVTPTFTLGSKPIASVKIGTISGGSDLYNGTSATSGIAISLANSKSFNGTTGGTIYCTISDGEKEDTKSAAISYSYFNYVVVSSSTSAPTTKGSGKNLLQSSKVDSLTTTDGTYIWFLMPNTNKTQIQQYAMSQWNNMNTTYAGTVEFTTDTGKKVNYHAYRTDMMNAATGQYQII